MALNPWNGSNLEQLALKGLRECYRAMLLQPGPQFWGPANHHICRKCKNVVLCATITCKKKKKKKRRKKKKQKNRGKI